MSWLHMLTLDLSYSRLALTESQLKTLLPRLSVGCGRRVLLQNSLLAFQMYAAMLRSGDVDNELFPVLDHFFALDDGLAFAMFDEKLSRKDANDLVKLPTLISNVFGIKRCLDDVKTALVRAVVVFRVAVKKLDKLVKHVWLCVYCIEHLCLFYRDDSRMMSRLCQMCIEMAEMNLEISAELKDMSAYKRRSVLETFVVDCNNAKELKTLLGSEVFEDDLLNILINPKSRLDVSHKESNDKKSPLATLIGYISLCENGSELLLRFWKKAVRHWSDPMIAQSIVDTEVVYLTHICLTIFAHFNVNTLREHKFEIVEPLMKGMPNHLSSSDTRNVLRAKLLVQMVTCTMSVEEDQEKNEQMRKEVVADFESDAGVAEAMREVLFHCRETSQLWYSPNATKNRNDENNGEAAEENETKEEGHDSLDEDDDSDLEPIESIASPPPSNSIHFLRQFLDSFPELSTHADITSALTSLPPLIGSQLALDHPQVGVDVLNMVFNFDNQFDDGDLEQIRKRDLVALVHNDNEDNIITRNICRLFNQSQLQAHRKCLILDVISTAAKETRSLVALDRMTRVVLDQLLMDDIEEQPLTVRIPLILCLSQQLRLLPEVMVREEYLIKLVQALSNLKHLDTGLRQAVKFALSSLVPTIEHVQKRHSRDGNQLLNKGLVDISQIVNANANLTL